VSDVVATTSPMVSRGNAAVGSSTASVQLFPESVLAGPAVRSVSDALAPLSASDVLSPAMSIQDFKDLMTFLI